MGTGGFFRQIVTSAVGFLADIVAPYPCPGCGGFGQGPTVWCRNCYQNLPWIEKAFCRRCGRPIGINPDAENPPLCGECFADPPFDLIRSACSYEGIISELIVRFKYSRALHFLTPLGEVLLEGYKRHFGSESFHLIIPVPLHRERLRERGYNQSALLAGFLAKKVGIPCDLRIGVRKRNTIPQVKLSGRERRSNLREAFAIRKNGIDRLRGKSVLIIDDVVTTGTTLLEMAKVLKKAGADRVCGLTIARSSSPS